ncbi:MAG TPA: glutathione S-transferase C-terminal domain-containing protein [Telmatospirillum sp.]|nr:glutathione S-transferase C-terminal domain-containing protein [Telmatospirillum sp.]
MLVNGQWSADWHPLQATDDKGGFVRQLSSFRHWITPDGAPGPSGAGGFKAEADRYHLYVALICPWASRTLIARRLKGLDKIISVSVVEPELTAQGWRFGEKPGDAVNGAIHLHELYTKADRRYSGRATVPVLWDKARRTIVNNESADILRMFNSAFQTLVPSSLDLYPEDLRAAIDALNTQLYGRLNNGVYRAGFAVTQQAHDEAVADVFGMLDDLEGRLSSGPYLFGARLTEADIRLFVTLVRFDVAYYGLFQCDRRRLADYPKLSAYLAHMLDVPGVRETVSIDHIKRGYESVRLPRR